jgi:hypothetical protein
MIVDLILQMNIIYLQEKQVYLIVGWIPDCRFYTTAQYNSIKASSGNVRATYPGVSSITTSTLTSGGTLNYYLIAPGYSGTVSY